MTIVRVPLISPGVEVLDGRQLRPSDVLGRAHYPLVPCSRKPSNCIKGSNATSQNALDVAAVEPFEDLRTYAKSF